MKNQAIYNLIAYLWHQKQLAWYKKQARKAK